MKKNMVILLISVVGVVLIGLYVSFCLKMAQESMKIAITENSYMKYFYYNQYSIDSKITYYSNKNQNTYELTFSYDYGKQKLVYTKPDKFKGMTLEITNDEIVHMNPYIQKQIVYYTTKERTYNHLLFTDFAKNYLNSEETKFELSKDSTYIILGVEVPSDNYYFHYQEMWIKKDTFVPLKMVVKNKDGEDTATIDYKKISVYNK